MHIGKTMVAMDPIAALQGDRNIQKRERIMANIANMEMASAVFEKSCIKVEKKFFGFRTNVTYIPTNSPVVGLTLEYPTSEGGKLNRLFTAAPNDVESILHKIGCPVESANGHWLVSICYSKDCKFAALQLSEFVGFDYKNVGEVRFAEGEDAEKLLRPFLK